MRRMPQRHHNFGVRRERDRRALVRQALLLACCLLLAGGFVIAARQQFAAVQYGYRSEQLRREREQLLEEQRRLRLALEENSSPVQLERAAREIGLQPARASQIAGGTADGGKAGGDGDVSGDAVGREIGGARPDADAPQRGTNAYHSDRTASTFVGSAAASLRR